MIRSFLNDYGKTILWILVQRTKQQKLKDRRTKRTRTRRKDKEKLSVRNLKTDKSSLPNFVKIFY
jgi:hypothetical protein